MEDEETTTSLDAPILASFRSSVGQYSYNHDTRSSPRKSPRKAGAAGPQRTEYGLRKGGTTPQLRRASKPKSKGKDTELQISVTDLLSLKGRQTKPLKKKKLPRGFAEPEVYAHLQALQDHLKAGLDVMFCGINPGLKSAEIGHHFGNPTNHFWHCLYGAGFTPELIRPQEDATLPDRFSLGLTNLVVRPTAEQNELSASEQSAGVPLLLSKVAHYRPRIVCIVGLGIAKSVHAYVVPKVKGKKAAVAALGLQTYKMVHPDLSADDDPDGLKDINETIFYAVPSTSGRVVQFQRAAKVEIFQQLKQTLDEMKEKQVSIKTDDMHVINAVDQEKFTP